VPGPRVRPGREGAAAAGPRAGSAGGVAAWEGAARGFPGLACRWAPCLRSGFLSIVRSGCRRTAYRWRRRRRGQRVTTTARSCLFGFFGGELDRSWRQRAAVEVEMLEDAGSGRANSATPNPDPPGKYGGWPVRGQLERVELRT
jgi:hypothetical protein